MKCNKCGSEWNVNPAFEVKFCPFCQQPLNSGYNESISKESAFKRGLDYYKGENVREDMSRALRYFKMSAEKGHIEANYYIGDIYYYGRGKVIQNLSEAINYFKVYLFKKSDRNLTAQAAKLLGDCYIAGYGTMQNDAEALKWYKLYFENGGTDPDIALNIAYMYQKGLGCVIKDSAEAVKWFELSYINKGNASAAYNLGLAYYTGNGVDTDKAKAFRYFRSVADKGYVHAQNKVAEYYYYGCDVIYKNHTDAMKWYLAYINNGGTEPSAFYNLGVMYFNGSGTPQNKNQAFNNFKKASDLGYTDAHKYLGDFYYYGHGFIAQNYNEAFRMYSMYMQKGQKDKDVLYNLGVMYFYGRGVANDKARALAYFKAAADMNHTDAQNWVGYFYYNGYGGAAINYSEALRWYNMYVSNKGNDADAVALYNMAVIYFYGRGTYEDKAKAFHYFQMAANKGHIDSQNWVGYFYYNGCGNVQQNFSEALRWYNSYMNNKGDDSTAMYNTGIMYFYGRGTYADKNKALQCFRQAAAKGNNNARQMIQYYFS